MYSTFYWRRSRRGATMWLLDWIRPLLAASIVGPGLSGAIVWLALSPWWWCALLALLLCPLARLRISAHEPDTLHVTMFWPLIPYRSQRIPLARLYSRHEDDYTSSVDDPHDELAAADWQLPCRNAATVVARLVDAGASLALPNAIAR